MEVQRIQIRNTWCDNENCPHVCDAIVDGESVYLELKCQKQTRRIPVLEVLLQIIETMSFNQCGKKNIE